MRGEEIAYRGRNEKGDEGVHFVNVEKYLSGEPRVLERPQRVDTLLLRPRSMVGFLGGLFWVDALDDRLVDVPSLILPFVPGARQDRLNATGDYLFTAKSVAEMINARLFPSVTVLDPHSDVIAGMIDRCVVKHPHEIFPEVADGDYDAIISPDSGAEKRAGAVAKKLGLPLVHGWKSRDVRTGEISGFGVEAFHLIGKNVLVVDDICDGGGTFVGLAEALKARGATADLYVTHGLFTRGTSVLLDLYRRVYCTDSVVLDRPGINIIPICQNELL